MATTKTVQSRPEYYIQFTEEELERMNIKEGDKFSYKIVDDGVILQKFATIDFDLSELSRDTLEFLISESCINDLTISEVITNILEQMIANEKIND